VQERLDLEPARHLARHGHLVPPQPPVARHEGRPLRLDRRQRVRRKHVPCIHQLAADRIREPGEHIDPNRSRTATDIRGGGG
jgi:hypothetical protein